MDIKISVWGIYETANGYSRVSVSAPLFKALTDRTNVMPFTTSKDGKDRPIKVYNIEGTKLFTRELPQLDEEGKPVMRLGTDGKEYPTTKISVYMKTEDANKFLTNSPDEIEKYDIIVD